MKKRISLILTVLLVTMLCVACSTGSNPNSSGGNSSSGNVASPNMPQAILGTWKYHVQIISSYTNSIKELDNELTFYSDGSCSGFFVSQPTGPSSESFICETAGNWVYLKSEQMLRLLKKDQSGAGYQGDLFKVTINGNIMTLENVDYPETKEIQYMKVK